MTLRLAVAISAAVVVAGAAAAQTGSGRIGAPIQLRPSAAAPSVAPGAPSEPPADAGVGITVAPGVTIESTAPSQRPPTPRGLAGSEVEVGTLKPPDPSAIGTLDESAGGLGAELWQGSRLATVKLLLPRLPMATGSAAMQSLARRLLLTPARPPEADDQKPSLLALRVERLSAGGRLAEINELLRDAPMVLDEPELIAARADALWLAGEVKSACALALDLVGRSEAAAWQKAAAFCHALAQEPQRVELYEQLLHEAGHQDQPFFHMLGTFTGQGGKPLASLPEAAPLHLAMLRALNWPLPSDAANGASPLVLRSLVDASNATPDERLAAAERAAALGALEVDALRRIYGTVSLPPQALRTPEGAAQGPRANAVMFLAARQAERPDERARLLSQALAKARAAGAFASVAAVYADSVAAIAPEPALDWFAADAGQALLSVGNVDGALAWWRLVNEIDSPEAQAARSALWPPLLIAAGSERVPFDEHRFDDWWRTPSRAPMAERGRGTAMLLSLLAALGRTVPPALWDRAMAVAGSDTDAAPSQAYLQALRGAAAAGRRGETVLLALLNLGPAGPAAAHPLVLSEVVSALNRVGLEADARQAALEAVLARQF
jgi:hypothetical protein